MMLTTALTFLGANWKDLIKYAFYMLIFFAVMYYIRSHQGAMEQVAALQKESTQWQNDYRTAQSTNQALQSSLDQAIREQHRLEGVLLTREKDKESLQRDVERQKDSLKKLEEENEQIRSALGTSIPVELWCQVVPNSPECIDRNKNPKAAGSGNPSAAVPSAPRTKD